MSPRRRNAHGPRRPKGEGTVFQRCEARRGCPPRELVTLDDGTEEWLRPDHNCRGIWIARVEMTDGTRAQRGARTQNLALKRLEEIRRDVSEYGGVGKSITVEAWCTEWLDNVGDLRPKTRKQYRSIIANHIVPVIGGRQVRKVEPRDIRAVMNRPQLAALTSTRRQAYVVLNLLWEDAKREGYTTRNVVEIVRAPSPKSTVREGMSTTDARKLLSHNARSGDRLASRWAAAFYTLQRPGECLGLTWDRVIWDHAVLDVTWQLDDLPYKHGCGDQTAGAWPCGKKRAGSCPARDFDVHVDYEYDQLYGALSLVKPKSRKGERIIPMVPSLRVMLEQRYELYQQERASYTDDHGLVWCRIDGKPLTDKADGEAWAALCRAAGAPVGDKYAARHTGSTLLYEAGVSEPIVQALMGHAKKETSHGYAHPGLDAMRREMTRALETPLAIGA